MSGYTKETYEKRRGQISLGRILWYDRQRGFGFIHTEDHEDIFLSSYWLGKGTERHISVGALVSFIPAEYEGKYVASDLTVLDQFPCGWVIRLPGGPEITISSIKRIRFDGVKVTFISESKDKYEITDQDLSNSAGITLKEYWDNLNQSLFSI